MGNEEVSNHDYSKSKEILFFIDSNVKSKQFLEILGRLFSIEHSN